jgi:hypothetical protein
VGGDGQSSEIVQNPSNGVLEDHQKVSRKCDQVETIGEGEGDEGTTKDRTKVLGERVPSDRQCIAGVMRINYAIMFDMKSGVHEWPQMTLAKGVYDEQSGNRNVYISDITKNKLSYQRQNADLAKSNAYLQSQLKRERQESHSLQKENLRLHARILELGGQTNSSRQAERGLRSALRERMPALKIIAKHLDDVANTFMEIAQGEEEDVDGNRSASTMIDDDVQ